MGLADHGSIKRRLQKAVELGLMSESELVSKRDNKIGAKEEFEEKVSAEFQEDKVYLNSVSTRIKSKEDLMEHYGLNPDDWDVDRIKVGNWEVSMKLVQDDGTEKAVKVPAFRIDLSLARKAPHPLEVAIRGLIDDVPALPAVDFTKVTGAGSQSVAAELAPVDIHFGKFAWHPETMGGSMNSKIASKVFIDSCTDNLEKLAKWPLAKIFFIAGS